MASLGTIQKTLLCVTLVALCLGLLTNISSAQTKKKTKDEQYAEKLAAIKPDNATGFYNLGVWCQQNKLDSQATTMFEKTLELSPDHSGARQKLGFIKYLDRWMTAAEKDDIINAEKGLVKYGGKWMKPEEMESLREKERASLKWEFKNKFQTRVFTIFTDIESEAERKDIAASGDNVYEAFVKFLAPYSKKDVSQVKLPEIKMYYYETTAGMQKNCVDRNIGVSSQYGFALGNESFQAKDMMLTISDTVGEVILHEGAHILDSNLIGPIRAESWWIVEGVSCYFQSVQRKDGKLVIGERKDMWELRGPTKYHKLESFCDYDRTRWDQEINTSGNYNIVYCQASTLFRFFMQAEGGKYRDRFIREVVIGRRSSSKELAKIFDLKSINDLEDSYINFANEIYAQKIKK